MQTDQELYHNYNSRIRSLVAEAATTGQTEIWSWLDSLLMQRLSAKTRFAMTCSEGFFIPLPKGNCAVFAVAYRSEATIAHALYWDSLDELCKTIHTLTGVREVHVRGTDVYIKCFQQDDRWIRGSVMGGQ